ncbi:aspartate aminotransferase family protein [Mycolicibacterium wolinskyi]|uniref:aspartate aminotransferase family protein n=2 Tax=Mycolicibacterium wolinskyi TaxID=59750 RepID=UPI003917780C
MCPFLPAYAPPSVMFVHGEGTWLWDSRGQRYLDMVAGVAVTSLGHSHPRVAAALASQASRLLAVSNYYATDVATDVAEQLTGLLGGGQVFFANSGAEANECALKLARRHGGRERPMIVTAQRSFHGRTFATLAATGQPSRHEPFAPMPPWFRYVEFGNHDALEAELASGDVAAVLLETVQAEGGVHVATQQYWDRARVLCDRYDALLMLDEVQTGLSRTGAWFGHQLYDLRPDVVTLAKALGNGVPVGACWANNKAGTGFRPGLHGSTVGGQPLAMAAAREVLTIMAELDAPALARRAGERLRVELRRVAGIAEVRGEGLLLAAELDTGQAVAVATECLRQGLAVNAVTSSALRLTPSLLISDAEITLACEAIATSIAEVAKQPVATAPTSQSGSVLY